MRNASDFGGDVLSDEYIDQQWRRLNRLITHGIGVGLKTDDQYTVVVRTITGGPAAESRLLSAFVKSCCSASRLLRPPPG